jgi:hypothetical protein
MHYVYISVLLVSLCLGIPEPEFCDYSFSLFEVIDHQLQHGMAIWMVTVLDGSPIEWGFQVSPCQAAAAAVWTS